MEWVEIRHSDEDGEALALGKRQIVLVRGDLLGIFFQYLLELGLLLEDIVDRGGHEGDRERCEKSEHDEADDEYYAEILEPGEKDVTSLPRGAFAGRTALFRGVAPSFVVGLRGQALTARQYL